LAIDTLEMLIASEPLVAEAFKATITSLSSECLGFLITGDMAYGVYGNARFTRTLDILAHQELRSGVADSLLGLGFTVNSDTENGISFRDNSDVVEIAVRFASSPPEKAALSNPSCHDIFQFPTKVIKLDYLVWTFCITEKSHMVVQLVHDGFLDVKSVRSLMQDAGDAAALQILGDAETLAYKTKDSSYSKSVEARLSQRQSGERPASSVFRILRGDQ
jgi:hypothetical protein